MEPVYLWHESKPSPSILEERVRHALGITRAERFRRVRDPWGNYVDVELDRVLDHIANHPTDHRRWEMIPAIIPAIKRATHMYESGSRQKYEARLRVYSPSSGRYERVVFVATVYLSGGRRVFDSLVAPTKERVVEHERRTAGPLRSVRDNPVRQWSTPAPGALADSRRTPTHSPGTASARYRHDSTIAAVAARAVDLLTVLFG
ncbi:MAG: hypothetical protein M1401_03350 [Chloroflexi bacterium]|nr:hypothetical protein [Chloroflexota bacterium]